MRDRRIALSLCLYDNKDCLFSHSVLFVNREAGWSPWCMACMMAYLDGHGTFLQSVKTPRWCWCQSKPSECEVVRLDTRRDNVVHRFTMSTLLPALCASFFFIVNVWSQKKLTAVCVFFFQLSAGVWECTAPPVSHWFLSLSIFYPESYRRYVPSSTSDVSQFLRIACLLFPVDCYESCVRNLTALCD